MSNTKWTQGEWSLFNDYIEDGNIGVAVNLGNEFYQDIVVLEAPCHEEEKANAHLIAAAPDLYDALEALQGEISNELWKSVDAGYALKKARGEL